MQDSRFWLGLLVSGETVKQMIRVDTIDKGYDMMKG